MVSMQRYQWLSPCLLLYANLLASGNVSVSRPHHIRAGLAKIKEEVKRRALFGTQRPASFELRDLFIGPRPNLFLSSNA
jgi:hypothetical protein